MAAHLPRSSLAWQRFSPVLASDVPPNLQAPAPLAPRAVDPPQGHVVSEAGASSAALAPPSMSRRAADMAADARLEALESELKLLKTRQREFAALRLQRWSRAVHWRRRVLPRQLLRA
eukprot:CAMPEP_0203952460 /NCGR_PEP_ID=MMETSP0359-20131031/86097_1 /ASSEMBLY_ACC=CAM_ASM_000338 /TAXON_ID=268821 /ORGANISM="Scrippsiella Hangoei, Strain SHTV-5" /LENGTH=117 /DNA_ID=CAMNT_0050885453 /DNA_START=19 /DNA_END=369 /DNA_ORIENTATION=-